MSKMNQLNYFKETEKKNKGSSEFFAPINVSQLLLEVQSSYQKETMKWGREIITQYFVIEDYLLSQATC
jgi:hypothetical protein